MENLDNENSNVAKNEETVVVDKQQLNTLIAKLEESNDKIKRLEYAADKGRLFNYDLASQKPSLKTCKLTKFGEDIVLAWKLIENDPMVLASGALVNNQTVRLFLKGKKEPVDCDYLKYVRTYEKVQGDIVADVVDGVSGSRILDVQLEDGEIIKIDVNFVN
jgi:hypothetical protein